MQTLRTKFNIVKKKKKGSLTAAFKSQIVDVPDYAVNVTRTTSTNTSETERNTVDNFKQIRNTVDNFKQMRKKMTNLRKSVAS